MTAKKGPGELSVWSNTFALILANEHSMAILFYRSIPLLPSHLYPSEHTLLSLFMALLLLQQN